MRHFVAGLILVLCASPVAAFPFLQILPPCCTSAAIEHSHPPDPDLPGTVPVAAEQDFAPLKSMAATAKPDRQSHAVVESVPISDGLLRMNGELVAASRQIERELDGAAWREPANEPNKNLLSKKAISIVSALVPRVKVASNVSSRGATRARPVVRSGTDYYQRGAKEFFGSLAAALGVLAIVAVFWFAKLRRRQRSRVESEGKPLPAEFLALLAPHADNQHTRAKTTKLAVTPDLLPA